MHKVFISCHHINDETYKTKLLRLNDLHGLFIDGSVDTGGIDENLPDGRIREIIRDEYLRDTTVTILLVGTETKRRKHIDWEIYSSMFDGQVNKKSGVLVVTLPSTGMDGYTTSHNNEQSTVYPEYAGSWTTIETKSQYTDKYPYLPERIIDNLATHSSNISVIPWDRFTRSTETIHFLINATFDDRQTAVYDLSTAMRRSNS